MRNGKIDIGRIIKKRRKLLGLLQPQLAQIAGISARTLQMIENGKGNPALETLLRIADPLGMTIELRLKNQDLTTEKSFK
jgi:transcriptional regulator with XRE-family HTH domain